MGGLPDQIVKSVPKNWRKKLKECYEKHFGKTGKAKNNISLCMYAAPLKSYSNSYSHRYGTLLTGDINLSCNVIDDMKIHFGINRWKFLEMVQVPHHGSQHSWTLGNTAKFLPAKFVQCATPTKNHPHINVITDLINYKGTVYNANRKLPVNYTFIY